MPEEREKDFYWSENAHPHNQRRKEILEKYPEIKKLFGPDIKLAIITVFLVSFQMFSATYLVKHMNVWVFILYTYFIGATVTHALFLAIHEITHNLAFKKQAPNNWLAIFANIPIVFPYAMSFKVYHTMHHRSQGVDGIDVDIPTFNEAKTFKGSFEKFIWAFTQIFFYAFRPMMIYKIKIGKWQIINIIFQVIAMAIYIPLFGWWEGILYLLLCNFIAGSIHPLAGHFITEHYVFREGQETYSYYGPLNKLAFNVGYHNEHHDFPSVPFSRLPKVKKIAPDYYENLYSHKSWSMVIFRFITSPVYTLFSRIKRKETVLD